MYDVVIIGETNGRDQRGNLCGKQRKKSVDHRKKHRGRIDRKSIYRYPLCGNYDRRNRKFFCQRDLKIQAENTGIDIIYEEVTQVELQGIKKVFQKTAL